jgi:hypothetical protein
MTTDERKRDEGTMDDGGCGTRARETKGQWMIAFGKDAARRMDGWNIRRD